METPNKIDLITYTQQLNDWHAKHTDDAKPGLCKICDGHMYMRRAYVSLHDSNFGDSCAGWGKVLDFYVPFCSGCEPVPNERGCIHIPTHPIGLPLFQPGPNTEMLK